ncbi:MAG: HEAT repeat domain-containing protein [Bacteriovoracaceae bacterium]|nr:HEAT repeat domain-containing protein [Bacteriovoracaceae bacterium]
MSNKKIYLIGAGITLLVILISLRTFYKKDPKVSKESLAKLDKIKQLNLEVLQDKNATDAQIASAILVLSRQQVDAAFLAALKNLNSSSVTVRINIAKSLKYFSKKPGGLKALKALQTDRNKFVRYEAIVSLVGSGGVAHLDIVKKLEATIEEHEYLDQVAIIFTILKTSKDPMTVKKYTHKLLTFANAGDFTYSAYARANLIELIPTHPETLKLIKKNIVINKDFDFIAQGIIFLAMIKDKFLKQKFDDLIRHKSQKVSLKAIESLHVLCPDNLWEWLFELIYKYKAIHKKKAALNELKFLPRKYSLELIDRVLKLSKDSDRDLFEFLGNFRKHLTATPANKELCQAVKF